MRRASIFTLLLLPAALLAPRAGAQEPAWSTALASARLPEEVRQSLRTAYEERAGLLWLEAGAPSPQALALARLIAHADERGLLADEYGGALLGARLERAAALGAGERAALDVAFSAAALAFAVDLERGRVDPRKVHWRIGLDSSETPPALLLGALAAAGDVNAALEEVEPTSSAYRRTREALRLYLGLAARGDGPPLPAWKGGVSPGQAAEGLDALAARLVLLGDLVGGSAGPVRLEGPLLDALRQFQRRHGLNPDGRIDKSTAQALRVPLADRVQQLALTLERARWLPRDLLPPLIVVNIPEFELHAFPAPGGQPLDMKVVIGRAYHHRTPVFVGEVHAVEFHPDWTVPADIARLLLPELLAHPERIAAQGFEMVDAQGTPGPWPAKAVLTMEPPLAVPPLPDMAPEGVMTAGVETLTLPVVSETALSPEPGAAPRRLRLRQRPGPLNALGPVKLDMPNHFTVYLHGTPSQGLFARERRDLSHGCVRVEDPAALANWVLAGTPDWSEERVRATLAEDESVRAPLANPIRVVILYSTAVVTEDGRVSFYGDVYGDDRLVERALRHGSEARLARLPQFQAPGL